MHALALAVTIRGPARGRGRCTGLGHNGFAPGPHSSLRISGLALHGSLVCQWQPAGACTQTAALRLALETGARGASAAAALLDEPPPICALAGASIEMAEKRPVTSKRTSPAGSGVNVTVSAPRKRLMSAAFVVACRLAVTDLNVPPAPRASGLMQGAAAGLST